MAIIVIAIFANINLATAQNMSRWIELTVRQGQDIKINLSAVAANTPIRFVSGSIDSTFIVNSTWQGLRSYYADSTTMRFYGDIKFFYCAKNGSLITGLDASNSDALNSLWCEKNRIKSLNVSGLTMLEILDCSSNWDLTSLDVSSSPGLKNLECSGNKLTSLNISGLTMLEHLNCQINRLTSLDVSGFSTLNKLYCSGNMLESLDVSGHTGLEYLYCGNNQLSSLNVGGLTALKELYCTINNLTTLDASGLTALEVLECSENNLTSLDVSGGLLNWWNWYAMKTISRH
ncbi:MAG: leucine-rich repeat domain-containing protein [Bacteroidales bacterium]